MGGDAKQPLLNGRAVQSYGASGAVRNSINELPSDEQIARGFALLQKTFANTTHVSSKQFDWISSGLAGATFLLEALLTWDLIYKGFTVGDNIFREGLDDIVEDIDPETIGRMIRVAIAGITGVVGSIPAALLSAKATLALFQKIRALLLRTRLFPQETAKLVTIMVIALLLNSLGPVSAFGLIADRDIFKSIGWGKFIFAAIKGLMHFITAGYYTYQLVSLTTIKAVKMASNVFSYCFSGPERSMPDPQEAIERQRLQAFFMAVSESIQSNRMTEGDIHRITDWAANYNPHDEEKLDNPLDISVFKIDENIYDNCLATIQLEDSKNQVARSTAAFGLSAYQLLMTFIIYFLVGEVTTNHLFGYEDENAEDIAERWTMAPAASYGGGLASIYTYSQMMLFLSMIGLLVDYVNRKKSIWKDIQKVPNVIVNALQAMTTACQALGLGKYAPHLHDRFAGSFFNHATPESVVYTVGFAQTCAFTKTLIDAPTAPVTLPFCGWTVNSAAKGFLEELKAIFAKHQGDTQHKRAEITLALKELLNNFNFSREEIRELNQALLEEYPWIDDPKSDIQGDNVV